MVAGCDVWLNTPEYPMEACGTSGQKAGINGVVNLSVLDGWWAEGFNRDINRPNGWAIAPHAPDLDLGFRNRQESQDLLDTLENSVIPAYFHREKNGPPSQWVALSKASMTSVIPNFSAERMLSDYVTRLYREADQRGKSLATDDNTIQLNQWKQQVNNKWSGVVATRVDDQQSEIHFGASLTITVQIRLNGLQPTDLLVECLVDEFNQASDSILSTNHSPSHCLRLTPQNSVSDDTCLYTLEWTPTHCGRTQYKLRVFPYHTLLCRAFEMGFMLWV